MEQTFIVNLLSSNDVVTSIRENLDKLLLIIPEIKDMIGFEHKNPHHHLNVFEHTLLALSLSPNNVDVRLILLLHDIGKPHSFSEGEIRHFRGHPEVSAKMSKEILTRLSFETTYVNKLCRIISQHDNPMTKEYIEKNQDMAKLRLDVQICDTLAHNPTMIQKRLAYIEEMKQILQQLN